jgi:hypothetical protein
MRLLSYQRKVNDKLFPELLVYVSNPSTDKYDYPEKEDRKKKKGCISLPIILTMKYIT